MCVCVGGGGGGGGGTFVNKGEGQRSEIITFHLQAHMAVDFILFCSSAILSCCNHAHDVR